MDNRKKGRCFQVPLEQNKKISLIHKGKISEFRNDTSSQEVPENTFLHAGLTLEAAIIFPVFLFLIVGVLYFFRILQISQITEGALASTGARLAVEAEEPSALKAIAYFQKELEKGDCSLDYIVGGRLGIVFCDTEFTENYVDLQIHYNCKLPISIIGIQSIPLTQRIRIKRWTGYHIDSNLIQKDKEEIFVYITPNGDVYHFSKECTHLQLSIQKVGKAEILSGERQPCKLCGEETSLYDYYYVTDNGEYYHTGLNCSSLKRTIYIIPLSEAEGRTACNRCGGK